MLSREELKGIAKIRSGEAFYVSLYLNVDPSAHVKNNYLIHMKNLIRQTVENTDKTVRIIVEDDGVGFDITKAKKGQKASGGLGLFTVRERLDHLGGSMKIESEPNKGCRVTIEAGLTEDKELAV